MIDGPYVQPGWTEPYEQPQLQLRTTPGEFPAGRYRLIFEVRSMVVCQPFLDRWGNPRCEASGCQLWFIDGIRLGSTAKNIDELPEPEWGHDWDYDTEGLVKPSERPPRLRRKAD